MYEELDYAFTPILLETVFKNNWIDNKFRENFLSFKSKVDEIPNEIWEWEFLDKNETWKNIRSDANELLNKLGISSREYNDEFTTVILSEKNKIK